MPDWRVAGAGLPRTGRIGFELFDRTNLGASDFAEQINYRRALEGELERTVATLSEVEQARIHITFAKESVFLDARQPSKATVVLRLKRMAQLPQSSVVAVANLVAGAVDGLAPEAVAIIDSSGRLLSRPQVQGDGEAQLAEANLDYRRQVESELLTKINTVARSAARPGSLPCQCKRRVRFQHQRRERRNRRRVEVRGSDVSNHRRIERRRDVGRHAGHGVEPASSGGAGNGGIFRAHAPDRKCLVPAEPDRETYSLAQRNDPPHHDSRAARPEYSLGGCRRKGEENPGSALRRKF